MITLKNRKPLPRNYPSSLLKTRCRTNPKVAAKRAFSLPKHSIFSCPRPSSFSNTPIKPFAFGKKFCSTHFTSSGIFVGRVWRPNFGPVVVGVHKQNFIDLFGPTPTAKLPTTTSLFNGFPDQPSLVKEIQHRLETNSQRPECLIGPTATIFENSFRFSEQNKPIEETQKPILLSPIDFQAIKAAGVTFVKSMLERVIEEQARGDPSKAQEIRSALLHEIGDHLSDIKPGSPEAEKVKQFLLQRKLWSQYLEVGLGKYAEIFTKAQPLSSVGFGAKIGIHPESSWNNPEPEIVLVADSNSNLIGATLGNDVNLRDFEGRSALLLSKAKDNNGSCAIGPLIRLFDSTFSIDDIRNCDVSLNIRGTDGFTLNSVSSMKQISRDPLDLIEHTTGKNQIHQYPDGFVLFTGTMFAPTQDRAAKGEEVKAGQGFTHHVGDIVSISSTKLGQLSNTVDFSDQIPPWTFGIHRFFDFLKNSAVSVHSAQE